jgi:diguanylate cyclase (GGDEF)-like protein/PAS domain S-box-containing protein
MSNKSVYFHLPDDLPNRAQLIDELLLSGVHPISLDSILANSENHYQGLFDQVPISIWEEDYSQIKIKLDQIRHDGVTDVMSFCDNNPGFVEELIASVKVISINQTGITFYGAKTSEQLLSGLTQILHDDSSDIFKLQLLAIWENQTTFNHDGVNYTIDGKRLDVNVRWKVFPGCEQTYSRILLTVLDISKQQEIKQALKFSEERYQAVTEITSDYAYAISLTPGGAYKIEWVTESFTLLTGYTFEEVKNASTMDLFTHPDDRIMLKESVKKIIQGQTVTFEMRFITKSGIMRWVQVISQPVKKMSNSKKLLIIGAVKDITDRKFAEIALLETQEQLQLRIEELEKSSREIYILTTMTNDLQLCHSTNEAYQIAAETANQLFPEFSGALFLKSTNNKVFQLEASWGHPPHTLNISPADCWAIRRGAPFYVHDEPRTLVCAHSRPITEFKSSLCMPIIQQGDIIGLFCLESSQSQPDIDQSAFRILSAMSEQFGLALTNIHLRESLSEQAVHDPLTNLYNRYYMEEFLEKELHRAHRSNKPVSVIMIDMDHFRDLNALFGHPNVDIALANVGDLLVHSIRAGDVACRYGGDEFLLILPEATVEVALERAEKMCSSVHNLFVQSESRPPQPITFSVGIACYPRHGQTVTELLRAADAAVFSAKDRGRDRVEIAA